MPIDGYFILSKSKHKAKRKMGRPTKYKPEYCQAIIDYFSREHTRVVEVTHTNTKGDTWTSNDEKANPLPTIDGFCAKIGVSDEILVAWTKRWPAFLTAYTRAKQMQKDMLLSNALTKGYDSGFAQFVGINCCGMISAKGRHEFTGQDGTPIVVQIVDFAGVKT
jgi:hypothetical protein